MERVGTDVDGSSDVGAWTSCCWAIGAAHCSIFACRGARAEIAQTWNPMPGLCVWSGVEGAVAITDERRMSHARAPAVGVVTVPGDAAAFGEFYTSTHANVARALALTLGDVELGGEAADEAMTRAYQRWHLVSGYDNPAGWVYRVGLNWALSFLRRRRRSTPRPDIDGVAPADPTPSDPALRAALDSLDPKHRSVVVLRYLLDWSVDQTATALNIAPGTVKSRLHRALAQLVATMGDQETL